MKPTSVPAHGRRRAAGVALAVSLALTVVAAWPVVTHPLERMFGAAIVGRHYDPFTVMQQFAGVAVTGPYLQPATDWLGRALAHVIPPIAAYNVVILWTFPLAAAFASLLAFEVTGSVAASVIAGLLFAFAPFHTAQAAYHPHVAQVQWMALYFLALWRSLHGATIGRAAILIAATALVGLSNDYGGFIAMTLTPVAIVAFWLAPDAEGHPRSVRDLAVTTAVWLALGAGAFAAANRLAPGLIAHPSLFTAPRLDLFRYSAQWWSYLMPSAAHPFFGGWAIRTWESRGVGPGLLEQQVGAGWSVLTLAVSGLWLARSPGASVSRRAIFALATVAAAAFLCSLSPEWRIGGVTILRPSGLLYRVLPMFRAYARFAVVVQLLVSVAAGWGVVALWRRRSALARTTALALSAAVVFEIAPVAAQTRDVLPSEAHRWLAGRDAVSRVLECRPWALPDQANGWLLGRDVQFLGAREDCASPDIAARLAAEGVSHLIVRSDRREMPWLTTHPTAGLSVRAAFSDSAVLSVAAAGATSPYVVSAEGFDVREYDARHSWRWMSGQARWMVVNPRPTSARVELTVDLQSFAAERTLRLTLNDEPEIRLRVGSNEAQYRLGPLDLRPGPNALVWSTDEPAVVADEVLRNGDRRRLAVAVGAWRWESADRPIFE